MPCSKKRVSRSSALASKATGFPIAKIASLLAIGRTFKESLQKAVRSLEIDRYSLDGKYIDGNLSLKQLKDKLKTNCWDERF
ncbi:MAG: hypothetical protein KAJ46_04450 [Sedimentisphaerales bacterium]|nr:hypothetical protein [Sedimentisphaerales bacterium]